MIIADNEVLKHCRTSSGRIDLNKVKGRTRKQIKDAYKQHRVKQYENMRNHKPTKTEQEIIDRTNEIIELHKKS